MQSYEAFQPTANFLSKIVILQHSCDRIITIAVTTPSHHVIYIAFSFSESPRQPCRGCIIIQKIEKSPALQLSVMGVKSSKSELWYSLYKVGKAILWESDTMNRWKLTFPQNVKKYKYFTKSFENMKLIDRFANVNAAQIERFSTYATTIWNLLLSYSYVLSRSSIDLRCLPRPARYPCQFIVTFLSPIGIWF